MLESYFKITDKTLKVLPTLFHYIKFIPQNNRKDKICVIYRHETILLLEKPDLTLIENR